MDDFANIAYLDERYKRHQRERRRLEERGEQSSSGSEDFEEGHHGDAARKELEWKE